MSAPGRDARRLTTALIFMAALLAQPRVSRAQDPAHGVTPADLERGGQTYLATCASCHGANGDGVANVDLASGTFRRAATDQELVGLIRNGITGTAMSPSGLSEAQALLVVAYLRSLPALVSASRASGLRGTAAVGKTLYASRDCATCHKVGGEGGFLGPDLSSVGITRRADELERALTNPSADIRNGTRTVSIVGRDGATTMGRLLNQDTYSLQFIGVAGRLTSVRKDAVRTWEVMTESAMPSYTTTLTPQQIADIVSYLQTLDAPVRTGGVGGTGRGGGPPPAPPAGPGPAAGARGGRGGAQ
jgi:putative heme-binding domain-containing protein